MTPWNIACQALCPWDFPGKNTGVDCHFLFQGTNAGHVCSIPGWGTKISHAEEQLCYLAPTTEPLRSGALEPQLEKPLCTATRESPCVSMKTLAGKKKKKEKLKNIFKYWIGQNVCSHFSQHLMESQTNILANLVFASHMLNFWHPCCFFFLLAVLWSPSLKFLQTASIPWKLRTC